MDEMLLVTDELSKVYKKVTAVNSVSLHIKKGTIYGLIGKNGAGKTTIMKMITGMATPTSGSFKYSGFDGDQRDAYSRIGALIEAPALLPNLSAYDNIKLKCLNPRIVLNLPLEILTNRVVAVRSKTVLKYLEVSRRFLKDSRHNCYSGT